VLPSTEDDADPTFSFSVASTTSGLSTPPFARADSLPPSGVPPRLQTHSSFADSPSSAASSPRAASADLSVDYDRHADVVADSAPTPQPSDYGPTGNQSPALHSARRILMGGAADFPQRSSSPLKRRASSMEPEQENADAREDVDMITAPDSQGSGSEQGTRQQQDEQETAGSGTSDRPVANVAELPLRTGEIAASPEC
jgi:hypothetical protein